MELFTRRVALIQEHNQVTCTLRARLSRLLNLHTLPQWTY